MKILVLVKFYLILLRVDLRLLINFLFIVRLVSLSGLLMLLMSVIEVSYLSYTK
jgi:hypothetical protein